MAISVSGYTNEWRALHGPKTDWKFWAMLGTMSGWNVEVLADSLPTADPARYPKRENIRRFARDHLKGNSKGDQFIVVYSGHCDKQGLVLADGSRISPQELRDWFVKPLALGGLLWTFFDCCESSNLLGTFLWHKSVELAFNGRTGLRHKVRLDGSEGIQYDGLQTEGKSKNGPIKGTIISIGSAAGESGEMDLNDPRVPNGDSEPLHCGPLAWAAYVFFHSVCKEGVPHLAAFLPVLKSVLRPGNGQEAQITTSAILRNPVLPLLRAPPSPATTCAWEGLEALGRRRRVVLEDADGVTRSPFHVCPYISDCAHCLPRTDPLPPYFGGEGPPVPEALKPLVAQYEKYTRMYQHQIDRTAPFTMNRWLATAGLNALFLLRVIMAEGWYIVCYAHAIYLLNLLLAFLQPKFDPSLEQDLAATNIEEGGDELPTTNENTRDSKDDEFRPFVRRLPEWQFWQVAVLLETD
ncbi:hypothetical protein FRC01_001973 [Tulasnella sp. 417]|nr:hypothetical protein FRC01_001973 [Tulasnella sp. 417]